MQIKAQWSLTIRTILPMLVFGLAGAMAQADAADRIFANGFEPCCTLGGEISGLAGSGLVLHLASGAISEDKTIIDDGGGVMLYTFTNTALPSAAYAVTITTQPSGQTCTLSNAIGTMASIPIDNINVTCVAGPANLVWDEGAWDDANWQ